jgi:HD-GYP domain-containing protein (c-di-GMP phosphodiesterase class II)
MIELAHALGESQGLPVSELDRLSLLAILHDIGKATISEDILTKSGKLTEKEWEIIRNHPEVGSRITSASNEFASVSEEILSHHERWDGLGYPRGLKGESIPFLARIISIVDAYDVMIHDRPYRKTVSKEEALNEIERCAGTQFDPELAADFIRIMYIQD